MKYTSEHLKFIKKNCDIPRKELAELFNKKFNVNQSVKALNGVCKRNQWLRSEEHHRFKKGRSPFNKGLKGYIKANSGSFKKGNIPHNYRPVGTERITKDGYIEVKIKDPRTWRLKHLVVWESKNGKIPKGNCISFIDGNPQNCDIDNLQMITRNENGTFNRYGYSHYPIELRPALRAITKLDLTIKTLSA